MNRYRMALAAVLLAASVVHLGAQVPADAPPPSQIPRDAPAAPTVPPPAAPAPIPEITVPSPPREFEVLRPWRAVFRLGQDLTIPEGDLVREATVIFGNARVAGRVDQVVVVLGSLQLASTASIGNAVVVGGSTTAEAGAAVRGDFVSVGGSVTAPADFSPGGAHIVFGSEIFGAWLNDLLPYLTRGLLWGRLIVPDLEWVWGFVAFLILVYLIVNVVFERPVRACAATLSMRPLSAFGAGLLVLLLVGPVSLLLAASVIGLAVVPFVLCAIIGATIVGKVAVARWMGMSILPEAEESRAHAARSFVIGFALLTIAYMIPVVGIVTWAIATVLGLGGATLAFLSAYRRENPKPVAPPPTIEVPPPPVPTVYSPPADAPAAFATADRLAAEPPPIVAYEPSAPAADAHVHGAAYGAAPAAAASVPLGASSLLVTMPRALFRDRLAAFVLDVIVVAIGVNLLNVDAEDAFLPFLLVYHIGFWTWKQTTVGGIVTQLRVVRTDGAPLTFADALIRGLASIFSLAVLFIGALWMLRDPDSQTWHDKIAATYVVKVPKSWPL